MARDPLTVSDAMALTNIMNAAFSNKPLARLLIEEGEPHIIRGVARSVCTEDGFLSPPDADVRDLYLRVTGTEGLSMEYFWPISELIDDYKSQRLWIDYPN